MALLKTHRLGVPTFSVDSPGHLCNYRRLVSVVNPLLLPHLPPEKIVAGLIFSKFLHINILLFILIETSYNN